MGIQGHSRSFNTIPACDRQTNGQTERRTKRL